MKYEEAKEIVETFATRPQSAKIEFIDVDGPTNIYQRTSHVMLENDGWKREVHYIDRLPNVVMSNVLFYRTITLPEKPIERYSLKWEWSDRELGSFPEDWRVSGLFEAIAKITIEGSFETSGLPQFKISYYALGWRKAFKFERPFRMLCDAEAWIRSEHKATKK